MSDRIFVVLMLLVLAWGSVGLAGEIAGINDICNRPDIMARMPQYMKDGCKTIQQKQRTIDVDNKNHQIIDQGFRDGTRYRDVYAFPPGSTYEIADNGKIIIHSPGSEADDQEQSTTAR